MTNRRLELALRVHQARGNGVTDETRRVEDAESIHQLRAMRLDGLRADSQLLRDGLARPSVGDELEHLHLPGREDLRPSTIRGRRRFEQAEHMARDGLGEVEPTTHD